MHAQILIPRRGLVHPGLIAQELLQHRAMLIAREVRRREERRDPFIEEVARQAAPAHSATQGSAVASGGSTTVASPSIVVPAGGFVVFATKHESGSPTLSSVSGGGVGTWTIEAQVSSGGQLQIAWGYSSGGNTGAITGTFSASCIWRECSASAYTGIDSVSPRISTQKTATAGSGTPMTPGPIDNTGDNDALYFFASAHDAHEGNYGTSTIGGTSANVRKNPNDTQGAIDLIVSSAASRSASVAHASGNSYAAALLAFKASATSLSATIAATMPGLAATIAAQETIAAALAASLDPWNSSSLTSQVIITAQIAATIPALVAALQSGAVISAQLAATVPALSAIIQGNAVLNAELAAAIPGMLAALHAVHPGGGGSLASVVRRRLLLMLAEEEEN